MMSVVMSFQGFLRNSPSPLPVFDIPTRRGLWRGLVLRRSEATGETIAIVKVGIEKWGNKLYYFFLYAASW